MFILRIGTVYKCAACRNCSRSTFFKQFRSQWHSVGLLSLLPPIPTIPHYVSSPPSFSVSRKRLNLLSSLGTRPQKNPDSGSHLHLGARLTNPAEKELPSATDGRSVPQEMLNFSWHLKLLHLHIIHNACINRICLVMVPTNAHYYSRTLLQRHQLMRPPPPPSTVADMPGYQLSPQC
jgi:hypothetical protein